MAELDTEKGFGTGLRAQLAKRQDGPAEPERAPIEEPAVVQETWVAEEEPASAGELQQLRDDLAAVFRREQALQAELAELDARYEHEAAGGQALTLRSAEVDSRAARVAAHEAELEEHPQPLADVARFRRLRSSAREHLDGVLGVTPAVAALVALCFAERPKPLHALAG